MFQSFSCKSNTSCLKSFSFFFSLIDLCIIKVYVRETPTISASVPFVSMAEMMKRFQSSTRDLALPSIVSHVWIQPSTSTKCFSALHSNNIFTKYS